MRRSSVMTLLFAFLASLGFMICQTDAGVNANDCVNYLNETTLLVPENVACDLESDIDVQTVLIRGQMVQPKNGNWGVQTISCETFTLEAGGKVDLSGSMDAAMGPGNGNEDGSGGSHGGRGGSPENRFLTREDSVPYGSFHEPTSPGSAGGGTGAGKGGGRIKIEASDSVTIDGILTVDGSDATGTDSGGGSGGSIWIICDHMTGAGVISARGGTGSNGGGGGAGGRISIHHDTQDFRGQVNADGGMADTVANYISISGKYASSSHPSYQASQYGLIGSNRGWRPNPQTGSQNLEFRFPKTYVTSMEMKGGSSNRAYVTSFNVRYYNDTVNTWVQVGDENYEFEGNSDYSSTKSIKFPWPLLCTRLRVYPRTSVGGIEMSMKLRGYTDGTSETPTGIHSVATSGGPGGPGTIYFKQSDSPGIGKLIIDNFAKKPYVYKESSTTKEFDIITQGGAAWVLDETESLDEILVNDGSHLVLNSSTRVSNIIGDGRSMIHIAPGAVVTLGHDMTTHCYVYEGAVLNLTTASISIGEYLYVRGRFDSTPDAKVTLNKPATVYFDAQDITISELTIEEEALMTVTSINDEVFNLTLERFEVHGKFTSGPMDLADITDFIVGAPGEVVFDPVDEDEHLGENIEIRGAVTLGHAVSFKRPCEQLLIDLGKLSWLVTASTNITMECKRVVINGVFSPGAVSFGEGIEEFTVGNNGIFTITAYGPIFMNGISIAGTWNIQNLGELKSKNGTNSIIDYVVIYSPKGKMYMNRGNKPEYDSDGVETNANCSILRADHLIINGVLSANSLDIGEGTEELYIDDHGDFTFRPCDDFKIHEIYTNGSMKSDTPLTLKGTNLERVHDFIIDTHGSVAFDNDVVSAGSKTWTGTSHLGAHNIEIAGTFNAGRLENRIAEEADGSWDSLSILKGGKFYFEPENDFAVDYMSLNGIFHAYKNLNILTYRPEQDLVISIGSTGDVRFDSLLTNGWQELSTVTAKSLTTSANSFWSVGDTTFDIKSMIIGGTLKAHPSEDISATYFEVTSTGNVDISNTVNISGQAMVIRGILDVSYQHDPENGTAGSKATEVIYDDITVSGTFKAASLYVESDTLTVSGTIDVSGGGYLSDQGPGAGQTNSGGASGASHGSRGGRGQSYTEARLPYGDFYIESTWGSGGGSHLPNDKKGGRGGGYGHFYVEDTVIISGNIKANALNSAHGYSGGGSGGNIYITTHDFTLTGNLYCNGGSSTNIGGGGAGGIVTVYYTGTGNYHSGYIESKGGSTSSGTAEKGGPGIVYVEGPDIKNFRVDNRCQQPKVEEPTGSTAGAAEYERYISKGATAALKAPADDHTFTFTHLELYGGAHLWLNGNRTKLEADFIYGDDTAHLHIASEQTLEIKLDSQYRRANVTYEVYLYEGATWIMPESIVEFREPLDQKGLGMADSTFACSSSELKKSSSRIWGTVIADKTHLLVSTGAKLDLGLASIKYQKFGNLTIQDGGVIEFHSDYNVPDDIWELQVGSALVPGMITIEAGGLLKARNIAITTTVAKVDKKGTLSATGQGLLAGEGAGTGRAGGGFGGRGGNGDTAGEPGDIYGWLSGSASMSFGSGGSSASTSYGAGGGMLHIEAELLIVEGTIESNGAAGTTSVGGGSGGTIYIDTKILEGSGTIQVVGGAGGSNTGGGGGGRLMIDYHNTQFWFGGLMAEGGSGYTIGGAGTVYLQDSRRDLTNRTLIIDNAGQALSTAQMSASAFSSYEDQASRTWIPPEVDLDEFESIRILGKSHLALHPDLKSANYELKASKFEGDKSGNLHIGPGQTAIVNHPDNMEFLVNVYVYEGGILILPPEFICYDISFYIWGTIGVYDLTVGYNCHLYLGNTGATKRSGFVSNTGIFDFDRLTVASGGEVTPTSELVGEDNIVRLAGNNIRVQGGGIIHAIHVDMQPVNLIVDDLGEIIGDYHDLACDVGEGFSGSTGSGAGHGGRGGPGSGQALTGEPYGCLINPVHTGCRGGSASVSGSTVQGGRGGGTIYLKVTGTLHNDGEISVNGEAGKSGSGGGSAGSIFMEEIGNIKGYGEYQAIGGAGSVSGSSTGGGGSGGMIALYFAQNFTYSGSWDVYGGLGGNSLGSGSSGIAYFYHTGYDHETLYINNRNRGPEGDTNTILDYTDLSKEQGHTWILGECQQHGSVEKRKRRDIACNYEFHELQIYGRAHLAVDCKGESANIYFHNMIGDRSGAIHVGPQQTLDLEREKIDLPFHVHVYNDGFLGMAPDTNIHGINIYLNGTLAHIKNLTIHHGGNLWLYNDGRTQNEAASHYEFEWVHVKDQGYLHMITDPVWEKGIHFTVTDLHIDGGGLVRGTHLYFHAVNISIDSAGTLSADELGYSVEHHNTGGALGIFGEINPGLGYSGAETGSGAGHGGGGGRGEWSCVLPVLA